MLAHRLCQLPLCPIPSPVDRWCPRPSLTFLTVLVITRLTTSQTGPLHPASVTGRKAHNRDESVAGYLDIRDSETPATQMLAA
jgi:hypothetical protein